MCPWLVGFHNHSDSHYGTSQMSRILRLPPLSAGQTAFLSDSLNSSPAFSHLQGITSLSFMLALLSDCVSLSPPVRFRPCVNCKWSHFTLEKSENLNTRQSTLLAADVSAAEPEQQKAKQQEAAKFVKAPPASPTSLSVFNKHALFRSVLLNHCKQPPVAMHHFPHHNGSLIAHRHKSLFWRLLK